MPSDEFVKQLTAHQPHLLGYVSASLGGYDNATDVLQQANVTLLQRHADLRRVDEFLPWAITITKFTILSFVRDAKRDRLVFAPEVVNAMTDIAARKIGVVDERRHAIRDCLKGLPQT
ncbi:MAG: sigma factor, partial [Planctomycetota bacterium]